MKVQKFDVEVTLLEDMLGTQPKNKTIYADYIATRVIDRTEAPEGVEAGVRVVDNEDGLPEDELATVSTEEGRGWTGFPRDEQGIFVYDYLFKGFMKEAGNTLKDAVEARKPKASKDRGITGLRSKLDRFVFIYPRRLRILGEDGVQYVEPDGVLERPLRAMTAQGPRVTLVRSDTVPAGSRLKLQIHLLEHAELDEALLRELLDYGMYAGLGQFKNGGYGRFEYTMEKVEEYKVVGVEGGPV